MTSDEDDTLDLFLGTLVRFFAAVGIFFLFIVVCFWIGYKS